MEDPTREKLLEEFESTLESRKPQNQPDAPASRFEPVYLVFFQLILVASMGALEGFTRQRFSLRERPPESGDWWDILLIDSARLPEGLLSHLSVWWYADLGLVLLATLVVLSVKPRKRMRRFYRLVTVATMVVIGSMVLRTLLDHMAGVQQLLTP